MDTAIELDFADGKYRFWLGLPQALELERKCGSKDSDGVLRAKSIFQIYDEFSAGLGLSDTGGAVFLGGGRANAADILETIRLGLIGGGRGIVMDAEIECGPLTAQQLVKDYCFPARPLAESLSVAWAVLNAAIEGVHLKKRNDDGGGSRRGGGNRKPIALQKGAIIANCGAMHLDWERLSMSAYFEALEAHNDMHNPEAKSGGGQVDAGRLRKLMDANRG